MRIGIYSPYLDSLGGGEKYILTAASCLAKVHSIEIFWDDPKILLRGKERFGIDISKIRTVSNIFSQNNSIIHKYKETKKYDAILFLSNGSIPFIFSKKLFLHFQFPVRWANGKSFINQIKIKRVTDIICNSVFTKGFIDKTFSVNSKIVYPPCIKTKSYQHEKKENSILTVGRFEQLKNGSTFKKHEFLIEIFKKMVNNGLQNWRFILVISFQLQDREKAKNFEKLTKSYPIEIIFNASNKELDKLYEMTKIYWHAAGFKENLEKHPELAEHFGIATVQAMEQGSVPVVINEGGQKEIVDEGENGFLWNTEDELIQKTMKLVNNQSLWKQLSGKAREKSKMFSEERFCKTLLEIIK